MKNSSRGRFLGILMRVETRLKCSPFSKLFTKKTLPIEAFFLYYFKYFDSKELIYFIRSLFSFSLFFFLFSLFFSPFTASSIFRYTRFSPFLLSRNKRHFQDFRYCLFSRSSGFLIFFLMYHTIPQKEFFLKS